MPPAGWKPAAAAGVVAFIAYWLFSYTAYDGAAWTSWLVGLLFVIVALIAVPASMQVLRAQHHGV